MPHPLRRLDSASIYHLVSRGNNGGWIGRDAIDRAAFRSRFHQVAADCRWTVFAWCLMTTHYHVVLRAPDGAISLGMQRLNTRHAQMVNRRHGRTGHLFQNRFFSVEVASDAHLISSIAYVNRNPFAAHAVEAPEDWRDSSYRATMGLEPAPRWLDVEFVLGVLGRNVASARKELSDVVRSGRVPVSDTVEAVRQYETRGRVPEGPALLAA